MRFVVQCHDDYSADRLTALIAHLPPSRHLRLKHGARTFASIEIYAIISPHYLTDSLLVVMIQPGSQYAIHLRKEPRMTKIASSAQAVWGSLANSCETFSPSLSCKTPSSLMDIDPERLDFIHRSVQRIIQMGHTPASVQATLDPHRGAAGRRCGRGDHPRGRHGRLAARH